MMEEIRTQAVQRVEAGESLEEVIRVLGCTRTVITAGRNKYQEGDQNQESAAVQV